LQEVIQGEQSMLTELETTLLGIMMMVIMLGMGASMTWRDFLIAFPQAQGHPDRASVAISWSCPFWAMRWRCCWACRPRWRWG
jgi:hypothetical protein